LAWAALAHRALTGLVGLLMLWMLFSTWRWRRNDSLALTAATAAAVLYVCNGLIGALQATRGYPADLVWLHALTAPALVSALAVLLVALSRPRGDAQKAADGRESPFDLRQRIRDLVVLTKPIIVALLLVTTYAGMVVGQRGWPPLALVAWTMLGGALAAGGASAMNQYIDRDLDRNMQRTAKRPLAARRMTPAEGLAFGVALCLIAFYILAGFVNLLAALLSLAGMVYYVLLYSIWLKRLTVQNIVIGGGAGAIPPLVGWAAATGGLSVPALFLFAVVFLWTPPHFWALALVRRKDYSRAGVPMLPVIKGEHATRVQIFVYTLELVGLTLLAPVLRLTGGFFLVSALGLGGYFVYQAWRVLRTEGNKNAWLLYRYSSMYLMLLFAALCVDVFVKL
jgi:protoheme IX farnesyltransferase